MKAAQAQAVYDRVGRAQDWQFYEDSAIARLLTDCAPQTAQSVFEFGCGTGRLAVQMLELLPPTARYLGVDVSPVMVALATQRLATWGDRARVRLVDVCPHAGPSSVDPDKAWAPGRPFPAPLAPIRRGDPTELNRNAVRLVHPSLRMRWDRQRQGRWSSMRCRRSILTPHHGPTAHLTRAKERPTEMNPRTPHSCGGPQHR